eukprot:3379462-Alexandrium_andersonii.AAC.1
MSKWPRIQHACPGAALSSVEAEHGAGQRPAERLIPLRQARGRLLGKGRGACALARRAGWAGTVGNVRQ